MVIVIVIMSGIVIVIAIVIVIIIIGSAIIMVIDMTHVTITVTWLLPALWLMRLLSRLLLLL